MPRGAHALARGSQDGKRPQGPEREPSPANAQSFGGHASHARAGSAHAQRPSTTPARHTASAADLLRLWKGIADGDLAAVEEVVGAHPLPGSVGGLECDAFLVHHACSLGWDKTGTGASS
ncbi:hypothetical protein WJX84_007738 [Apatococcus fuscideae]|uniref:Uncharacterized protein n=1 Tax=Apatococcus fuscideae TaxID=2026836 RepID=A0AAW1TJJ3_9CHLO